jgi:enoyl-CoA hydratase/carnithine racemase
MPLWTAEIEGKVAVARYANPPMNYFCAEAMTELSALVEQWQDPAIRAVVLRGGVPDRFITHYSVEELLSLAENREAVRGSGAAITAGFHELLGALRSLPKPIVVAMTGDTMGGGFELSLACDIRVAQAGDYRIGFPESTLGILPGGGGTQRLSRLIGASRAIDFILRGRVCHPERALELGLVHEVVPDAAEHAVCVAQELATLSGPALAQIKRAVYEGSDTTLRSGLEIEGETFFETMLTDEAVAAMREYVALPFEERRSWIERKRFLQGAGEGGA